MNDDPLIECVPNFAEGRDSRAIHAIVCAMRLPGVHLLDVSTSAAQNRTVVTVAGEPTAVCEGVIRAAGVAAARIDLTRDAARDLARQPGICPRIGAIDVLPIVPIAGISLSECAMLAREVAEALWSRYSIPSYLYAAAASRPDRVELDEVRRGQFEGLREAVLRDLGRRPDVGGPGLHPSAGATAVGARRVLIEYRLSLGTDDLSVARALVRDLRGVASGLRALAVMVDGVAQLWLHLADYRQVSIGTAYAAVAEAAAKRGIAIGPGELIGLLPEAAYEADSAWVAGLTGFVPGDRILERRLLNPRAWPDGS